MATMQLELKGNIHVLTLTNNEGENKLNQSVMEEYLAAFDAVEKFEGNTALLITCEHEKTFSTGIDLEWMMAQDQVGMDRFVRTLEQAMYKLAMLNAPTVACLNGNTYAGSAIMMTGADFRIMRSDRGRFCYPEVNIRIPFSPIMNDIIHLLPNKHELKHMALTGKAYTGEESLAANIVDAIYPMAELQERAFEYASELAQKDRATYTTIKRQMRPEIAKHQTVLGLD